MVYSDASFKGWPNYAQNMAKSPVKLAEKQTNAS